MKKQILRSGLAITLLAFQFQAHSTLITEAAAGSTVVDFSQFDGDWIFGSGPEEIGGLVGESITWQTNYSSSVIGNSGYGLGGNGSWDSGRNGYTGLNTSGTDAYMDYLFNEGPVSSVGGFMNYAPDSYGDSIIEVLGDMGQVLETIDITAVAPISTPGGINEGAFRGISRAANDIYGFRISGAFDVLDDLSFSRSTAVAEPGTLALLGLGLFGVGFINRRKKG